MSGDKNEKPTSKKLEDARKKGQVAISRDLAKVVTLASVAELALLSEPWWRAALSQLMTLSVTAIGKPFGQSLAQMGNAVGQLLALVFGTCLIVCAATAFLGHWGQFGILVSTESLTPSLDKINPVNGIKQLFAKKKLSDLALSVFKTCVLGLLTYMLVRDELPDIVQLAGGEPKDIYFGFIALLRGILHALLGVCVFLGLLDFALQKYLHTKQLMMDMEEIKKEYKEAEGDPLVKGMRKQLAREWASEGPADKTRHANALVVNPTHFAVAMFYDPDETPVPRVLAKGKDDVALAMIAQARASGIPVIRHVWLARTLYATSREDQYVPKASYEAVAQVYTVVSELLAAGREGDTVELERYGDAPPGHPSINGPA